MRSHPAGVVGARNHPDAVGHLGGATVGAYPDRVCDGVADADHLSGGRHILGLGVSGPQVVEGW